MSKKTPINPVAVAVIEQINAYDRPLAWRIDAAKTILKIKDKEVKPLVTPKTAEQLQSEILTSLSNFVKKQGLRKLQAIVKGEVNLSEAVSGIETAITTAPIITPPSEDEYSALLAQMTDTQLFDMLKVTTTYKISEVKKIEKVETRAKGGYISVDEDTAYQIAAFYLIDYSCNKKNGKRTNAPLCFLGKRSANATQAIRRFLFSTVCADECDIKYSMPLAAYEFYKTKPYLKNGEESKSDLLELLTEEPSLKEMIIGWKDEPYIKSILKK